MTKPKKFSRRILIPVDDMIWEELQSIRRFEGIGLAESVRRALRAYLNLPAEPPKKDT